MKFEEDDVISQYFSDPEIAKLRMGAEEEALMTAGSKLGKEVAYFVPSVVTAFAETLSTSLRLTSREEFESGLQAVAPDFSQVYQSQKPAAELVGDIAGMFVVGSLGVKAWTKGSAIAAKLGNGNVWTEGLFNAAQRVETLRKARLDKAVELGGKAYASNLQTSTAITSLGRQIRGAQAIDSVTKFVAFEAGVYAGMNSSQVLYPDEFSTADYLLMGVGFGGAAVAIEQIILGKALRTQLQAGYAARANALEADTGVFSTMEALARPEMRDSAVILSAVTDASIGKLKEEAITVVNNTKALGSSATADQRAEALLAQQRASELNSLSLQLKERQKHQFEQMGKDLPVKGVDSSHQLSKGEKATLMAAAAADPFKIANVVSVNKPVLSADEFDAFYSSHVKEVERLNKVEQELRVKIANTPAHKQNPVWTEELLGTSAKLDALHKRQYWVMEPSGTVTLPSERSRSFFDVENPEFFTETPYAGVPTVYTRGGAADKAVVKSVGVDAAGVWHMKVPNTAGGTGNLHDFDRLPFMDVTRGWAAGQKALDKIDPMNAPLALGVDSHFTKIDFMIEALQRNPALKVGLPAGVAPEMLEVKSLAGKYHSFLNAVRLSQGTAKQAMPNHWELTRRLNLPEGPEFSHSPLLELFGNLHAAGVKDFESAYASADKVKQALRQITGAGAQAEPQLVGNMLKPMIDAKPVFLVRRENPDLSTYSAAMETQQALLRATSLGHLKDARANGGHLVSDIFDSIYGTEMLAAAGRVEELGPGVTRGTGRAVQQGFSSAENLALVGAQRVAAQVERVGRQFTADLYKKHTPVFEELRKSPESLAMLGVAVNARRKGWDVADTAVQYGTGFALKLKDTAENRELWQKQFGSPMPEDAVMPTSMGMQALVMDQAVLNALHSISEMGHIALANTNAIRKSAAYSGIRPKNFWVPPVNFTNGEVAFLLDATDNVVSIKRAPTPGQLNELVEKEIASDASTAVYSVSRSDVGRFNRIQDSVMEKMLDFSDSAAQTGKATGKQTGTAIEVGDALIKDMFDVLNRQFESVMRRTTMAVMEPQIAKARMMRNSAKDDLTAKGIGVYDKWMNAVHGNQDLSRKDSLGKLYYGISDFVDANLAVAHERILGSEFMSKHRTLPDGSVLATPSKADIKAFEAMEAKYGAYNPFQSAVDFAQNTYKISPPPNLKQVAAQANKLVAALTLRIGELGHPILNVVSLLATTPAVIKNLQRLPGEATADWSKRVGVFGEIHGEDAVFSPTRAMYTAIHDLFSPQFRADLKEAKAKGFGNIEIIEIHKTLDEPMLGVTGKLLSNAATPLTWLSDKSESFSKMVGFAVGYSVLTRGVKFGDKRDLFASAEHIAEQVVGNYRANNRPMMFQGATGMPIGLFMTFMWNYYQRLFDYVENKNVRALVSQYATQATVFGAQSVPGFQQFNDILLSNYDGTVNPVQGLRERLGETKADLVLYGGFANLPKIFGADGMSIHTRGNANFQRVPGLWSLDQTPVYNAVESAVKGSADVISSLKTQGLSPRQLAETVAQYSISRPLKNAIELGLGYSVDQKGQMVSDTVREVQNAYSRILGFRPLQEEKERELMYRLNNTEYKRFSDMQKLRMATRSQARGGITGEDGAEILRSYVRNGGSPENAASWIMQQHLTGTRSKAAIAMQKALTNNRDVQMYMNYMSNSLAPHLDEDE